jgi:rod shape-determining protein MreC
LLFLLLEGIALALLVQSHRFQAGQMKRMYTGIVGSVFGEYNNLTDYFNLRANNLALSAENARLRAQIAQSYQFVDRKQFIISDTVYKQQYAYINAKIISNSITKRNNYVMINKGTNQGVNAGMAVISSNGVVGVVKVASKNFASILSLLHDDSRISARIKNENYTGSVLWKGQSYHTAQMVDVPSHFKIQLGDTVVTSGYSLDFPEGIPIGTVSKILTSQGDNFHTLSVKLSTDFNRIDYVYVVKNLFKGELDNLEDMQIKDE